MQIMVFAVLLMLVLIGFFGRENDSVLKCFAAIGIPVTALFFVRGWCKGRSATLAVHGMAVLFVILIAGDEVQRIAYIIAVAALLIYSGMLVLNEKGRQGEQMPVGMAAFFVGGMLVGAMTGRRAIEEWSLYCGIAFILIQVFYHNLNNMNDIMLMNREISNFPAGSMVSVNMFIMVVVGVLCIGAMVFVNNRYVYRMVEGLGSLFIVLLRYIFRLLQRKDDGADMDEELITKDVEPEPENGIPSLEWESGLFQDIMNGIAMTLGIVFTVAILICLAASFVRLMRRFRGSGNAQGDIKEFVVPEGINTYRIRRRKKENVKLSGSGNMKVRKLYKSIAVKGAAKKGAVITSNMMPADISREYFLQGAVEATGIYEKARYGNTEASEEDVELLKKIRKNQKSI